MTTSLVLFTYLQFLDLLTTLVFIMHGVREANPLVKFALVAAPSPLMGLLLIKVAALALAICCSIQGRQKLLLRINIFFAALISWNLLAMIAGATRF
jgi:hypothetical protein